MNFSALSWLYPIYALLLCDRLDEVASIVELAIADGHARGSVWGISAATAMRACVHRLRGDVAASEVDAGQALAVPGVPPFVVPYTSFLLCLALLERGALDEAEAVVAASGCGPALPEVMHMNHVFWARSRLRVAQGRLSEARDDVVEFGRRCDCVGLRNPAIPWRADAALLHSRLGEPAAAERFASEYDELARSWDTPRVIGISARTRGLLAGGELGLSLLHEAAQIHGSSPARLEHARSLLELGGALRRAGRRAEARGPLSAAADLARRCAAPVLARQATEELRVAGGVGRRQAFSGAEALTPSERRVARMAAGGQSNRQIAEALFVTAKTVENHLGRVYNKLGIASRTELPEALGQPVSLA